MNDPIYLKSILCENTGPICSLKICAEFTEAGNPKPILLVGENGSGKSTALSCIADSFFGIGNRAYADALNQDREVGGFSYYKVISPQEIQNDKQYLISQIDYTNGKSCVFKSGNLDFAAYRQHETITEELDWTKEVNYKNDNFSKDETEQMFSQEVICCFHPNRYEKPSWMHESYYQDARATLHFGIYQNLANRIPNKIIADNCFEDTLSWLLDIIADSRVDVEQDAGGNLTIAHKPPTDIPLLNKARKNIEEIASAIVDEEIYFDFNYRNAGASRFTLKRVSDSSIFCPSLDSLSTGQLALFELFATIIRYADRLDLNHTHKLKSIEGIVLVDEVDLHLHPKLQRYVLPRLISKLPKVQFVMTTHSPLFLLGMESKFGEESIQIIQLPDGLPISSERYREFETAYEAFTETQRFHQDIENIIRKHASESTLPYIITEGKTDWMHLKAIRDKLRSRSEDSDLFEYDYEFFEYDDSVKMGNDELVSLCQHLAKASAALGRAVIFIADADHDQTTNKLSEEGKDYKAHGNNVYSFVLPVPRHRKDTPKICIEQMYTDRTMKAPVAIDGKCRRLYTTDEFDGYGRMYVDSTFRCEKVVKSEIIKVLDGNDGHKVISNRADDMTNYALSKVEFANAIANGQIAVSDDDFEAFRAVFRIIHEIIEAGKQREKE